MANALTREQRAARIALEDSLQDRCAKSLATAKLLRDRYSVLSRRLIVQIIEAGRAEVIEQPAYDKLLARAERLRQRLRREHARLMAQHDAIAAQFPA